MVPYVITPSRWRSWGANRDASDESDRSGLDICTLDAGPGSTSRGGHHPRRDPVRDGEGFLSGGDRVVDVEQAKDACRSERALGSGFQACDGEGAAGGPALLETPDEHGQTCRVEELQ